MTEMTAAPMHRGTNWFRRAEMWLDGHGRPAWITSMILGFIFFWPVGLALMAYMFMTNRFSRRGCAGGKVGRMRTGAAAMRTSGNAAFDAYKADTLRRLEEEQEAFESFLERLRAAKDKAEFDEFMDDRAKAARGTNDDEAA